jgi:hypothetical protein
MGIYESPVIQEVINLTWFANKSDEGIEYSSYFENGIPFVTIALVLTAVSFRTEFFIHVQVDATIGTYLD